VFICSNRVKSLSIVLQDIDDILLARDLTSHQQTELGNIVKHCQSVLGELNEILGAETRFCGQESLLSGYFIGASPQTPSPHCARRDLIVCYGL
jgi:hypothetical protein